MIVKNTIIITTLFNLINITGLSDEVAKLKWERNELSGILEWLNTEFWNSNKDYHLRYKRQHKHQPSKETLL